MMIRLMIQRHGYGKLADTLAEAAAALEGVARGRDARFLLNYRICRGIRNAGALETLTKIAKSLR
jgi:hypothetical protein